MDPAINKGSNIWMLQPCQNLLLQSESFQIQRCKKAFVYDFECTLLPYSFTIDPFCLINRSHSAPAQKPDQFPPPQGFSQKSILTEGVILQQLQLFQQSLVFFCMYFHKFGGRFKAAYQLFKLHL